MKNEKKKLWEECISLLYNVKSNPNENVMVRKMLFLSDQGNWLVNNWETDIMIKN